MKSNVSDVNLSHCMRNNRRVFFLPSVYRLRSEGVTVGLTCWPRAGGRGYKHCHHRSPEECRPERKRADGQELY